MSSQIKEKKINGLPSISISPSSSYIEDRIKPKPSLTCTHGKGKSKMILDPCPMLMKVHMRCN